MSDARRQQRLNRLRQLGLRQVNRPISSQPPSSAESASSPHFTYETYLNQPDIPNTPTSIELLIPEGKVIENSYGHYFSYQARYPLNHHHGNRSLAKTPTIPFSFVSNITKDDSWLELNWHQVLFVDLETTGLEIGAGTIPFLIGLGYYDFDHQDFVVHQYFMRDLDEESPLLHDLFDLTDRFEAVVSFNGKTFDLPLLENRFTLARLIPELIDAPHFDLLHPSRRIWRQRLENCRLSTLEAELLGVQRTTADVPGYLIPTLYHKYLTDNDARLMAGIFYHNELDILSMSTLIACLAEHFTLLDQPTPTDIFDPRDIFSVGLWCLHLRHYDQAEQLLTLALGQSLPQTLHQRAKTELAYLLKRQKRFDEAEPLWQELVLEADPLTALEELAKFYEWHRHDFESALTCINFALSQLEEGQAWHLAEVKIAWEHRKARVSKKVDSQTDR
ncbi:MAG: ribonuclease H-like domain-containing protein [Chloroflexota bacterium]